MRYQNAVEYRLDSTLTGPAVILPSAAVEPAGAAAERRQRAQTAVRRWRAGLLAGASASAASRIAFTSMR
jgi:hypothetical protein